MERVDADLGEQVAVRRDTFVSVPQVGTGLPIQLRNGYLPGDLKLYVHTESGVGHLVEVTVADLREALELLEVER